LREDDGERNKTTPNKQNPMTRTHIQMCASRIIGILELLFQFQCLFNVLQRGVELVTSAKVATKIVECDGTKNNPLLKRETVRICERFRLLQQLQCRVEIRYNNCKLSH
jgi:hypothetical protein